MHIKCLRRGTGSAGKASGYLVGERDAMGREREGVEVLRGDPEMVAAVADSLEFEHKYRSIVIAWAPEDRPTDAQIEAVLDEFEKTAWAGLEPDRYSWTAVLHREHGGGVHVHILTARCDLETGKSLNIAPPGWQKTFDPLRDAFNHEHGWSRPDDPARARTQQPGHRAYIEAANLRAGLEVEADPRELIRDYLVQRVEHGVVRSRADVVSTLEGAGLEVPRQGKDYVTARDPASGKRWRLKGALYEHDFNPERVDIPAPPPAGGGPPGDRGDGRERAAAARRELERRRRQRAAYHRSRYGGGGRTAERPAAARVDPAAGGWAEPFLSASAAGAGRGTHWLWTTIEQQIEALAVLRGDVEQARTTLAQMEDTTWGVRLREIEGERFVVLPAGTLTNPPWTVGGRACLEAVERVRRLYDRARTAVDGGLGEVVRAVRDGTAAALRAGRSLAAAFRAADRAETRPCGSESNSSRGN